MLSYVCWVRSTSSHSSPSGDLKYVRWRSWDSAQLDGTSIVKPAGVPISGDRTVSLVKPAGRLLDGLSMACTEPGNWLNGTVFAAAVGGAGVLGLSLCSAYAAPPPTAAATT